VAHWTDQPIINVALMSTKSPVADLRQRRRHVAWRPQRAASMTDGQADRVDPVPGRPHTSPRKLISAVGTTWKTPVIDHSNRRRGPNWPPAPCRRNG